MPKNMNNKRMVEVLPPNKNWPTDFLSEREKLRGVLGDVAIQIHHIGSTAIPNIYAKPVIDLLVEVTNVQEVDAYNKQMAQLGYMAHGENGIENRRYFSKGGDHRTHHVHIFERGNPEITRHIAFRDYLIAHPDQAIAYSELKRQLAVAHREDMEQYIAGKHDFIQQIDQLAAVWYDKEGN